MRSDDDDRLYRVLRRLTFSIVGQSLDYEIVQPIGSGFFIAPYTAITAGHVVAALWDELQMPWRRSKYPKSSEPSFFALLGHAPDGDRPDMTAEWQATSAATSAYTDIGFLHVVPKNDVAASFSWPQFPELELLAPTLGERVTAFGYPEVQTEELPNRSVKTTSVARMRHGTVLADFERGRGSWDFPQFETDAEFVHGMSGGPVVHDGKICGVVSYASRYEEDPDHSYAAVLWPLLLAGPVADVNPHGVIPLLSMLETGAVRSPGWRHINWHATVEENDHGKRVARFRRGAG